MSDTEKWPTWKAAISMTTPLVGSATEVGSLSYGGEWLTLKAAISMTIQLLLATPMATMAGAVASMSTEMPTLKAAISITTLLNMVVDSPSWGARQR